MHRLYNFIDKHRLLSDHQHGFRANRSTSMAVMELVDVIEGILKACFNVRDRPG